MIKRITLPIILGISVFILFSSIPEVEAITYTIKNDATGGDCNQIGDWDGNFSGNCFVAGGTGSGDFTLRADDVIIVVDTTLSPTDGGSSTFTNFGTIIINNGGTVQDRNAGTTIHKDGSLVENSGLYDIRGNHFNSGTININPDGILILRSVGPNGELNNNDGGVVNNFGEIRFQTGDLNNRAGGEVNSFGKTTIFSLRSEFNNLGVFNNNAGLENRNGVINNKSGGILNNNDIIENKKNFLNENGATINNNGVIDNLCIGVFTNNGILNGNPVIGGSGDGSSIGSGEPVADASMDQIVTLGDTVFLDGSRSCDPDGDQLTYQWDIISSPAESNAILFDPTSATPNFVPDIAGQYDIQLIVNDGTLDSLPDTVTIFVDCAAPLSVQSIFIPSAFAQVGTGIETSVNVLDGDGKIRIIEEDANLIIPDIHFGDTILLGSSGDPFPDACKLSYSWSFTIPEGSSSVLENTDTRQTSFVADKLGRYRVDVLVSDEKGFSESDTITLKVDTMDINLQFFAGGDTKKLTAEERIEEVKTGKFGYLGDAGRNAQPAFYKTYPNGFDWWKDNLEKCSDPLKIEYNVVIPDDTTTMGEIIGYSENGLKVKGPEETYYIGRESALGELGPPSQTFHIATFDNFKLWVIIDKKLVLKDFVFRDSDLLMTRPIPKAIPHGKLVAEHEIGHLFGLPDKGAGIMSDENKVFKHGLKNFQSDWCGKITNHLNEWPVR